MIKTLTTIVRSERSDRFSTFWIMTAAFLCYTGMYAVRKSFLAGQYEHLNLGISLDPKTVLVISQVLGYMCSKFLGIKIISEMPKDKRVKWLLSLVTFGLLMLGLFAILPPKLKVLALFLNGLPLGMVFGVVLSYLEGRRNTELLAAGLSATFIFSTGLVKTIGVVLIQNFNVNEYIMPFYTGLIFFPLFLLAIWMLTRSKEPNEQDIEERSQRTPMNAHDRKQFVVQNWLGFLGLIAIYILLTIVRDFRDNFIVEFWNELGYGQAPELITITEIPVAVIVLIIAALGIVIRNNKTAFNLGMLLTAGGAALILFCTFLFKASAISPTAWLIISGIGVYLPYILFHCLLFERLIALLKCKGNVGFLFYTADALGYLGSVTVMLLKEVFNFNKSWVNFFIDLNIKASMFIFIIVILTITYFNRKISTKFY